MPLDPNIYGSIRPAAAVDPMQTLAQVSVMRNQQLQRQEAQQRIAINEAAETRLNETAQLDQQKRQEELAKAERKRQVDSDLTAYLSSGQQIESDKVYEITRDDPERGTAVLHGLEALKQLHNKTVQDVRQNALQLMGGVEALGPDARVALWPQLRQEAIDFGYPAERIPEQYDQAFVQASLRSLQTPQQQADADKPKVVGTHVLTPDYKTEIANYPAEQKPSDFESYLIGPFARSLGKNFKNIDEAYAGLTRQEVEQAKNAYPQDRAVSYTIQQQESIDNTVKNLPVGNRLVLGRAVNGLPPERQKGWVKTYTDALANKPEDAPGILMDAALASEGVADRGMIRGRMDMQAALTGLATEFRKIPTDKLKGTWEDTIRGLTGETSNPELVRLGAHVKALLADYRHAITGAAFGADEAKDYEDRMPGYKKGLEVNLGLIQGFLDHINGYNRSYWEGKLGKDGAAMVGATTGADIFAPPAGGAGGAGGAGAQPPPNETPYQKMQRLGK